MTPDTIHVEGRPVRVLSETMIRHPVTETAEQRKAREAQGLPVPMWGYIAVRVAE